MMRNFRVTMSATAAVLSMVALDPAIAQMADGADGGEIVVTAQRRNETLRDVPISITVFGAEQIERQRITSLADYATRAPNLGFVDSGSSVDRDFTVRGVSNLGGFTRSNAIYVDEFNVTPGDVGSSLEQNLVDVERIEILRGPQGVFFGRNVIGGAVSMTSRKPESEFATAVTGEYASYNSWLLRGMVNAPIAGDAAAIRINGYWSEGDGNLKNISTGPDNSYRNRGARAALRLKPSDRLTLDFAAQYNELRSDNIDAVPTGEFLPTLNLLALPSTVDSGEGFYPENRSRLGTNIGLLTRNRNTQLTARLEWDFGAVSLIGVNGYIRNRAKQVGEGDLTALDAYNDDFNFFLRSYSTEWRLQSNGDGPFSWIAGVSYANDHTDVDLYRVFRPGVPGPFGAFVVGLTPINRTTRSTTKSLGIFANLSYEIQDRLTLSAGARYSRDRIRNFFEDRDFVTGIGIPSEGKVSFDNFSPRFSAVFEASDSVNIYATVSRGYKPGGYNFSVRQFPELGDSFREETAWNYEAGTKFVALDGAVQFNLSVFYLKWKDLQVAARTVLISGEGVFTALDFVQNAQSATSKGLELEATVRPVSGLTINGGVGFNRAKFGRFPNAIDFDGLGSTNPDGSSQSFDATGNTLPFAPEFSLTSNVDYRAPVTDSLTGFIGFGVSHKSLQFQDVTNRRVDAISGARLYRTQIPGYTSVSANLGVESDAYTVQLFVKNLFKSNHYLGARGSDGLAGTRVVVEPRVIGVRATYKLN